MTNPNYNPPPNIPQAQYTNQPENIIGANVTVEASHLERSKETETFEKSVLHHLPTHVLNHDDDIFLGDIVNSQIS